MNTLKFTFVDHYYHQKTRSGDFLRKILKQKYKISDIWIHHDTDFLLLEKLKTDYFFCFQILPPINILKKLHKPIIWVPMFDDTSFDLTYWNELSKYNIKILAFSERIYRYARLYGLPVLKLQYYLKPAKLKVSIHKKVIVYFWYRGSISINEVVSHIDKNQISEMIIRSLPDPGYDHEIISKQLIEDYHIRILIAKSFDKKEHLDLLKHSDIVICPRKSEGIGMANLEAIAAGKCLVGWNQATMNEYITHGVNGFLYGKGTKVIDLSRWRDYAITSHNQAVIGYQSWLKNSRRITSFCTNYHEKTKVDFRIRVLIHFIVTKRALLHVFNNMQRHF